MKKIIILNESTGTLFGTNGRDIVISDTMSVADAEHIKGHYPGLYVDVVDEPEADKTKTAKPA